MVYEIRKSRPGGYHVEIISEVIGCIGGSANRLREQITRVPETDEKMMTKTWRKCSRLY